MEPRPASAYEPGYTCRRCAGTPFDPAYHDEPDDDRLSADEFAALVRGPSEDGGTWR